MARPVSRIAPPRLLTLAVVVGCGGGDSLVVDPDPAPPAPPENRAPEATGAIPAQSIVAGTNATVDLSQFFRDPDGDALTYGAASSDTLVAEAAVSGARLILIAVSRGAASATVTASDGRGGEASLSFSVTVPNLAPTPVSEIASRTLVTGGTETIDVSGYFTDPEGDALTYSAASSDPLVAGVSVAGSELTMVGLSRGTAEATVTARDHEEAEARQSFELAVCAVPGGILHWWSGEGSGADRIGGVDATLMHGAGYAEGVPGAGEAFSFDGVDAIALVPNAPTLKPAGPFSVMAWAKPGPDEASGSGTALGKGHPWQESWLLDNHNGRWRSVLRVRPGFGGDARVYGPRLVAGEWTHLAMTWDGQRLTFYVNGEAQGTHRAGSINPTDGPVGIGSRSEEGFSDDALEVEFEGEIDEAMFFGRALGVEGIRSVIENTAVGFCDS
ncbi:MAG: hypothetical protein OXI39_07750 [Gemmatimonadota bacterium]|uniref:LamG domain-containing protein n=1 Tax=Candidatus Palauibacter scopulicola TaxID=3056741 RepID=UPI002385849C|nr:LamG-like jellyroll fold domain-containing protein [Candidatus Palauibacter scopulicola]MDE2662881.1 hypothetical protein [Candidatus Palauibacter scopulicola]